MTGVTTSLGTGTGTGIGGAAGATGAARPAHGSSSPTIGVAGVRAVKSICPVAYSWTSSMRVPKAPFGWTKATVVPREPGRGTWSMTWPPWSFTDWSAAAQSATR